MVTHGLAHIAPTALPACRPSSSWNPARGLPGGVRAELQAALGLFEHGGAEWHSTLAMTVANNAASGMLHNFHCSLRRWRMRYIVGALDDSVLNVAQALSTTALALHRWAGLELGRFTGHMHTQQVWESGIMCAKMGMVVRLLEAGYDMLSLDVDMALLRPFYPAGFGDADLAIATGPSTPGCLFLPPHSCKSDPRIAPAASPGRCPVWRPPAISCACKLWSKPQRNLSLADSLTGSRSIPPAFMGWINTGIFWVRAASHAARRVLRDALISQAFASHGNEQRAVYDSLCGLALTQVGLRLELLHPMLVQTAPTTTGGTLKEWNSKAQHPGPSTRLAQPAHGACHSLCALYQRPSAKPMAVHAAWNSLATSWSKHRFLRTFGWFANDQVSRYLRLPLRLPHQCAAESKVRVATCRCDGHPVW